MLFEKTGSSVWISHLDLMRVFQRAFRRAGLLLKHSQGFTPRAIVSIALPLSVGMESQCELLDFELEGCELSNSEIKEQLNRALIEGVQVRHVYDNAQKIKNLAYLDCVLTLEYDDGIPEEAEAKLAVFFAQEEIIVEKRTKNGPKPENIIPLIRNLQIIRSDDHTLELHARVCCQNPALNPMQLTTAIALYQPVRNPDFVKCSRVEVYDANESVFR